MTQTELLEQPQDIGQAVITYDVTAAKLQELADEYLPLTVAGIDDKQGLAAVHDARMDVRTLRIAVDKRRKELKAGSLEYGRRVDDAAKQLTARLTPIEEHLQAEEDKVKAEKDRIKREAYEQRQHALRLRLRKLTDVSLLMSPIDVESLDDEAFDTLLAEATENYNAKVEAERQEVEAAEKQRVKEAAERQRIEVKEAAERQAEWDQLKRDHAEFERQRAEQEAEGQRLAEERRELEAESNERERLEQVERDRKATDERIAQETRQRAEASAAEAERQEALKPDREKLLAVMLSALESAKQFCEAMEREAPPPFNKTPLTIINFAIRKATQ